MPRNTLLMGVRTIVRLALGIVILPILLNALGADRTGLFLFATSLTGYFTAVELGLASSLTKYVAEFRGTADHAGLNDTARASLLSMAAIGLVIAGGFLLFGVFGATALFHQADVRPVAADSTYAAAAVAALYWPTRVGPAALEGLERYDLSALVQIGAAVATLVAIWIGTQLGASVPVLVGLAGGILVVQNVVSGALAWAGLALRRGGRWYGRHLRPVIGYGTGLFVIGVSDTLIYSLDRTVVAAFVGPGAIVVYEVAVRLQSGVRSISALAGGALMSTVSRLSAQGRASRLRELVLTGSLLGVLITTPIAVLTMVLARPVIDVWVGNQYVRYAYLAQIFVSYWVVHSNTSVLGSAVTGIGRIRIFALYAIVSSLVILALSVALTAVWGTIGVILGTVIPSWIGLPLWLWLALRHVGIPVRRYAQQVLAPAYALVAGWSVLVLAANHWLPPHGFAGTVAFAALAAIAFAAAAAPLAAARWRAATDSARDLAAPVLDRDVSQAGPAG